MGGGQVVCMISGSHDVHSSHGWQQLSHGSGSGQVGSIVGTVMCLKIMQLTQVLI